MPTKKISYFSMVRSPKYGILTKKKQISPLKKIQNKALDFIFNIKGLTSFNQLRKDAGIESIQECKMDARFSLFTRRLAGNIQPPFEYDLERRPDARQNADTPYTRTNAHYNYFWSCTIRELRQWIFSLLLYSLYFLTLFSHSDIVCFCKTN